MTARVRTSSGDAHKREAAAGNGRKAVTWDILAREDRIMCQYHMGKEALEAWEAENITPDMEPVDRWAKYSVLYRDLPRRWDRAQDDDPHDGECSCKPDSDLLCDPCKALHTSEEIPYR